MRYERKYKNAKRTSQKFASHRDSYLKLIQALAVDAFGYAKNNRTNAVKKIRERVEESGMKLTEKPIRAILNLAVDRYKFLKKR